MNCGKIFVVEPWRNQKFCSVQCGAEFNKGITYEERKCLNCGNTFKVEPWRRQRFCSVACAMDFRRGKTFEERRCPNCGKAFKAEKWKKKKFCSTRCAADYHKGKPRKSVRPRLKSERNKGYEERTTVDGRRVALHRYLVEQKIGRRLTSIETVHHIDMDKHNNTVENLYLYPNESEHQKGHRSLEALVPWLLKKGIIEFKDGIYRISEKARSDLIEPRVGEELKLEQGRVLN